jgi:hypothetical protein
MELPYTLSGTNITVDASEYDMGTMEGTATVSGSTLTIAGFSEGGPNGTWERQ